MNTQETPESLNDKCTPFGNSYRMSKETHYFEQGNFGPTTAPLCRHCGLSEQAQTHQLNDNGWCLSCGAMLSQKDDAGHCDNCSGAT